MKKRKFMAFVLAAVMLLALLSACDACDHHYVEGVCSKCGLSDPDYQAPCIHEFVEGTCTKCGQADPHALPPCDHVFVDGNCENCGEEDPSYDLPCEHNFVDGVCTKCEDSDPDYRPACVHNYVDGMCTKCGEADPDAHPADGGASLYEPITTKFKDLILYKYMNEVLPPRGEEEPFYMDVLHAVGAEYDPSLNFGYAIKDINGDGYAELLLMGVESRVYAMFTILDGEIVHVHTFQKGMGYIAPDGMVFYNEKGADNLSVSKYMTHLVDGQLVGLEYGRIDAADGSESYYHVVDGVREEITKDAYNQYGKYYGYYWDYPTRLTRLTGFRYYPALPAVIVAQSTADFSTYEAVIDTFGRMYTEVALGLGKKYEKTKWTGGAYDSMMLFNSDEDFYIYNRLIAACVLAQSSSSASFGYALRDLNQDGIDELILLESQYCVLAIFTQVEGRAVLLESFTDCRIAWIDADGLIHIQERTIPGLHKKDSLYYVCRVENGRLVRTLAIGVAHDTKGVQTRWYQMVDGEAVEMEQPAWDALYVQYALDLGDTDPDVYTGENAQLTFMPVVAA